MNDSVENMRLLIELAVNSGRKRKSLQTGYLHYYYNHTEQDPHLPIPLIENFLFALALLRTRTMENITEAKVILEGLLHFQNTHDEIKGNFPIYLHDFPHCKDRLISIHIACVIFWILKQFHQVIGYDLKKRLETALSLSVKYALRAYTEKMASYPISIRIASAAIAAGQILGDQQLSDHGLLMLDTLKANPDETAWFCPSSLGMITASLLMVYPRLSESPWKFFWNHLQATWHRHTATYAGPSLKEWQEGEEPQVTLYDFFCGYFSGEFSTRALKESTIHLEAALIPANGERFEVLTYPLSSHGIIQGAKWFLLQNEKFAYSYIEKGTIEINQAYEKGFHPFRLIWGDRTRVHSFICQGGNAKSIIFNSNEVTFDLEGSVEVEDRDKNREILFFLDAHEGLEFWVAGQKASTFLFGEKILIKDSKISLSLVFEVQEGEGRFLGHRMLGNRPSQLGAKGMSRFNAYDWQIFLRTISRSDKCCIKAVLNIHA